MVPAVSKPVAYLVTSAAMLALAGASRTPVLAALPPHALTGVSVAEHTLPPDTVVRITLEQVERFLDEGNVVLVDVRADSAYLFAHLPDAVSIPIDRLEAELDRLRAMHVRIVFYCDGQAGVKSGRAATLLRQHGFRDVYCLEGGFAGWVASGRVVVVEPSHG
jgi:rhodanese-related sulfurtransferase